MRKEIALTLSRKQRSFKFGKDLHKISNPEYLKSIQKEINIIIQKMEAYPKRPKKKSKWSIQDYIASSLITFGVYWLATIAMRIFLVYPFIPIPFMAKILLDLGFSALCIILPTIYLFRSMEEYKNSKKKRDDLRCRCIHGVYRKKQTERYLLKNFGNFQQVFSKNNIVFYWSLKDNLVKKETYEIKNGSNYKKETSTSKLEGVIKFVQNPNSQDLEKAYIGEPISKYYERRKTVQLRKNQEEEARKLEEFRNRGVQRGKADLNLGKLRPKLTYKVDLNDIPMANPVSTNQTPDPMSLPVIENRHLMSARTPSQLEMGKRVDYPSGGDGNGANKNSRL